MAVTPQAGQNSTIVTGGTAVDAVEAVAAGIGGGFIVNPYTAEDQGFSPSDLPEPLYVDITGAAAALEGNDTTVRLEPGQNFPLVAGQDTRASVNATTSGHQFTVVWWLPEE